MSEKSKGPLRRLLSLVWNTITKIRHALFNLIFIALVIVVLVALFSDDDVAIEQGSVLLLAPTGEVVQQRSFVDPLARFVDPEALEAETPLRDLVDAVDGAREDARIVAVLLDLSRLQGIDLSSSQELGAALERFRQADKTVIASGDSFGQGDYLLATYADEIYLHPMGMVGLRGFGVYPAYMKELLERLQVDVHVFRVGQYKSAVEPFLRDSMSDDARANAKRWLASLWSHYVSGVAGNRDLEPAVIQHYVNHFDAVLERVRGDAARAALDLGLVDQLLTREEMRLQVEQKVGVENLDDYLVHFYDFLHQSDRDNGDDSAADRIAVVVAEGVIIDGEQPPGMVGGDSLSALLREAREDDDVKAVVLRIDSEGGSAFASEVIREQVQLLQQAGKPVVASMGSVAASGGYWIAAGADEIWAQPTTITGSIGIFGVVPSIYRTLAQWGIHTDGVGTTRLADGFRVDRPMSELAANSLQSMIESGYRRFIDLVAQSRGLEPAAVEQVAQGQVWSGEDAQRHGLVDHLGGVEQAIASAASLAKLDDYEADWRTDDSWLESGLWDRFLSVSLNAVDTEVRQRVRAWLGGAQVPGGKAVLPLLNDPAGVYLHCLECVVH